MLNTKFIDELSGRISQLAAATPAADLEKNAKALLASVFSRLELVGREEFDIQRDMLAKALEKLATLEVKVGELESRK